MQSGEPNLGSSNDNDGAPAAPEQQQGRGGSTDDPGAQQQPAADPRPGGQQQQQQHAPGAGPYHGGVPPPPPDAPSQHMTTAEQQQQQHAPPQHAPPPPQHQYHHPHPHHMGHHHPLHMAAWPVHMQYYRPAMPMVLQPAGYGYPLPPLVHMGPMPPDGAVMFPAPLSPQMVQLQQQQLQQQQQQQHHHHRLRGQPPHPPPYPPPHLMAPHYAAAAAAAAAAGGRGGYHRSPVRYGAACAGKVSSSSRRSSVSAACSVSSDFGSTIADDASVSSLCRTASTQGWIVSPRGSTAACRPEGLENQSWAWLVDGILSQVVQNLCGHNSLQAFRSTCRHWKAVADQNIRQLAPRALKPKDLVTLFPRLQVLELVQCPNVRNRDLYVLAQSPIQLRCLTLGDDTNKPWVTNRGLSSIGRMSSLQSLALHDCNSITNNGMTALSALRHLSSLSLRGCRKITNNGLEGLQTNSSLTSLNLHGCKRISDKGLSAVSNLPLKALSLGLTRVKDEGMAYLARLTQLTELHCTNEELTDEGIHHLSSLTDLNTLALRDCCEVSGDALLALLPSLPHLAHLNLYKNWEFGDEQLGKCIVHMLGLVSLDLRGTCVTDAGLAECTQLSNLRSLSLKPHHGQHQHQQHHHHHHQQQQQQQQPAGAAAAGAEGSSSGLLAVSKLTQLRSLAICLPSYSKSLLDGIKLLTGLRELDLSSDAFGANLGDVEPMPNSVVSAIASLTHLTSLDLSRRPLTERQLHELAKRLPLLHTLVIHGVPITNEQLARLERHHSRVNVHKRNSVLETMPELATLLGSLSIT